MQRAKVHNSHHIRLNNCTDVCFEKFPATFVAGNSIVHRPSNSLLGDGKPYTVLDFAAAVAEVFGVKGYTPAPCGKFRFGDTRHICSDISKIKGLGWNPTRSIHESVEAYKGWLSTADNAAEILDYCNKQMVKLNVVRDVAKS